MTNTKNKLKSGITLVEVLIAAAIILIFLLALFGAHNLFLKAAFSSGEVIKASTLAEEGLEAIRFLRNSSWNANIEQLLLDTDYFLTFTAGTWSTSTSYTLIDNIYERKIRLSAVYRDANSDIVASGGTVDPNARLVISSVSWLYKGATTTRSISTYITDLYGN